MSVHTKKLFHVSFFCIFLYHLGLGQSGNFFNYSIAEGLPQSQVFAICQDSFGYIWAGTQGGGVTLFDGKQFKSLVDNESTIKSKFINALYTSSDGKVWIGTMQGLYFYQNDTIHETKNENSLDFQVYSIIDYKDTIYVGTNKGMYRYHADRLIRTSLDFKTSSIINDMKVINGQLWVASDKGLFIQKSNGRFTKISGLPYPNINHIYGDDSGYVWLSIFTFGLIKLDSHTHKIVTKYDNSLLSKTKSILGQPNETLWLATENEGICILDVCNDKISRISEDEGFSTSKIQTFFQDIWGNIWIGTSGAGLVKKTNQLFKYYNMFDYGFGGNRVYAITNDRNKKIWVAVNKDNIGYFENQTLKKIYHDSLQIGVKIKTITTDTTGKLWIGTEGQGVFSYEENGTVNIYNIGRNSLVSDWITHIVADANNKIWIATQSSGIQCITTHSDSSFQSFTFNIQDGLPDKYINSLAIDNVNNSVWFVCRNGKAGYIDNNLKVVVFDATNGLPEKPIKTITIDENGNCFLGIPGKGVYVMSNEITSTKPKFIKITVADQQYSTNIYAMICDSKGNLWLGTENGAYKFVKDQKSNVLTDVIHFKKEDGFLGIENCHNSISKDENDNIWFGTMNGLVYYNSRFESGTQPPPILHMAEVLLFNQDINQTNYKTCFSNSNKNITSKLPYSQNHLSFNFDAVHVNFPDKLKFRYKLLGSNADWSSWNEERRINYSGIAPGSYCFMVQSTFDEIQVSNTEQVCFEISKPFWEENWFRIMAILLVLSILIIIFKWRESIIKNKAQAKTLELTLKNELLTLEQKALQLQMNPHFIFNALNSIQSLVVNKDADAARKQIQNFAMLMRGILNNSRSKTVTIQSEVELLTKYLNMEQFCQKNEFTFEIKVSENINQEESNIPSMLIQPYVENAIIHGISHLSAHGNVQISFELENHLLICAITDNGVGRVKANELSHQHKDGHISVSMEVTGQRLHALKNQSKDAGHEIIDLYDQEGKALGTKVILKIPVTTNY